MDPVTTAILSAITSGLNNLATDAAKDAYKAAKQAIIGKLGSSKAIDDLEADPGSQKKQTRVAEELAARNAAADPELILLATRLLEVIKESETGRRTMGKFNFQASGAQIGAIGDGIRFEGGLHFHQHSGSGDSGPQGSKPPEEKPTRPPEPQTSEGGKSPTVFISYSHKDEAFAVNFYRRLTADGIHCWFDKVSIAWGDNWVCALEDGLDKCNDLVLLLSPDWCRSEWTKLEHSSIRAEDPAGFNRKVRPLLLRPCRDLLPRFFRPIQAIDISTPEKFEAAYPAILKTLEGIPTEAGEGPIDPDLEPHIATYRSKAASLYEHLPLMGFRTKLRVPIRIEEIYVPLRAMLDLRATGEACFADAEDAEQKLGGRAGDCGEISLPQAFQHAEKMNRRGIVILGDPGSGKTTHLKRVLLWCLKGGYKELGLSDQMLPVFLPLRELTDLAHGLDAFIQAQLDKPHLGTPRGFGQRLLDRGHLLLLLDGLDEVADAGQRVKVSRWINDALTAHPTCRFVVTSRFAGYTEKARLSEQFLEMHIRPLDFEQVQTFVKNWYRIVEQGVSSDTHQAWIIADERSQKLIELLGSQEFRARRVFQLTRNPLLLANICLVHRDRGNLPKTRVQLYDDCTEVLLELWRASIGYETKVDAASGKKVLQPAALWLHEEEGRTRATADELAPVIEPTLKAAGWPHGDANAFLRTVRDESGLLTGWDQETYGFMHLGFQEYLAARQIQNNYHEEPELINTLVERFGQSWWQEVILLLLALDNPCLFKPFMQVLVQKSVFVQHPELVEMCLDDAAERPLKPFLDLLQAQPGKDADHWQRQLAALKLVERLDNSALNGLMDQLVRHPFDQIRERVSGRQVRALQKAMVAPKGGYELVWIPGDEFYMGSSEGEEGRYDEEGPQHLVRVPDFYLGRYPVTNEEYGRFLSQNPKVPEPAYWGDRKFNQPRQPVVGVSWEDAQRYAQWAGLHLPSEAQWEYACRAGTQTRYYTGNIEKDLDRAGWYEKNSGETLHPVGQKEPNAFGLYDMHGNVLEWVEDDWHDSYNGAPEDGSAWVGNPRGRSRVLRGGSWDDSAGACGAACRGRIGPGNRGPFIGFRFALFPGRPG